MKNFRFLFFTAFLVFVLVLKSSAFMLAQDIDPKKVTESMNRGIAYLKSQQKKEGNWDDSGGSMERCGPTALVVIALRSCGVPANDPSIVRAMKFLRAFPGEEAGQNYSIALQTMAFCVTEPERDLPYIRENVKLLEKNQNRLNNEHRGGWYYSPSGGSDLSNSQFSILALYEAERVGVQISDTTWRAALQYWQKTQNTNGSWGYTPRNGGGSDQERGSMACAGIASMIISAGVFDKGGATVEGERIICFQKPQTQSSDQIKRGLDWLAANFAVSHNPNSGAYHLYYMYALERVGRMSNQRFVGERDWYREGTDKILVMQEDRLGSGMWNNVSDTCFALLFLSKGRRPVLMSKVQFGEDDAWNVHPYDVNNLTLFVESKWKHEMTWQSIDIRQATVDHLLQSPVISFSSQNFPIAMQSSEMDSLAQKLREYLDQGGFILAEAQSEGKAFDEGFRTLMRKVFPEEGYELTLLDKSHPIWSAEQTIDPDHIRPIEGIHYGCRTSVVYIPPMEGKPSLSCLWEVYKHYNREEEKYPEVVQRQIDNGLGIGLNILAYATSRELKNKDEIAEQVVNKQVDTDRRGRIFLPFLDYEATNPAPHAPQNLLYYLESECNVRVEHQASAVRLTDESLIDYPVLFMHGRGTFQFSEADRKQLRSHLELGGFLFANAICSAENFTKSFQSEIKKVFPEADWEKIPPNDPIFSDIYGGFQITALDVRSLERTPDRGTTARTRQMAPELYGIRLPAEDRWLVVFSPNDISCALEKASSLECRGYTQRSALQLSANVILYAIEH